MQPRSVCQASSDLPPLRTLIGGAVGITLAHGAVAQTATSPVPSDAPVELPPIAVQGQDGTSGYQSAIPSLPKLTQPLLDTPQSIMLPAA
jgi:catecholate siderophore receptor